MSEKRQTAGETADGTPASAGRTKDASGSTDIVAAIRAAMADAEAHGVKWDETNTEAATKTFHVEIRLSLTDRLKLGILAARCSITPERFLHDQLCVRFDEVADKVFCACGKGRPLADIESERTYNALIVAALSCAAGGRMAFRPSVMA